MTKTCDKDKIPRNNCFLNSSFIVLVLFILLAIILGAVII